MLRSVLPVVALSTMLFGACSPKEAPGVVMLAVSTNLVPGRDFTGGLVVAGDLSTEQLGSSFTEFTTQEAGFPWTVAFRGIAPDGEARYVARARVLFSRAFLVLDANGNSILDSNGNPRTEERVIAARDVQFEVPPPEVQQMVHVSIDWLSLDEGPLLSRAEAMQSLDFNNPFPPLAGCVETQTRDAFGQCVDVQVATGGDFDHALEPYDPTRIFGGGSSPTDNNSCFRAQACLEGGTVVTANVVDGACRVELPTEVGDNTTLAVLTGSTKKPSGVVFCGELGCGDDLGPHGRGAVLDRETFSFSGRVVTLPSKICERFPDGAKLVVANSCAKKERSLPLCLEPNTTFGRIGAARQIGP